MRTLYVIAHPEATHHRDRIVGGWHDSELTPQGREDAQRIAAEVRRAVPAGEPAEIYTSDLKRAAQTAEAIADLLGITPIADRRLREKSYGVAEGQPQAWLDERFLAPPAQGDRMNHHEGVQGAETRTQFAQRIYAAMAGILAKPCSHQIIVSHGFALTYLVAAFQKLPAEVTGHFALRSVPGGITILREDDVFHNRSLVSLSATGHLTS